MSLDDAVKDSARALGARPARILPMYVAGLAVPVIVRVVPFLGIFLAYLSLRGSGRLEAVREVIEPAAPIPLDEVREATEQQQQPGEQSEPNVSGWDQVDGEALEEALLDLLTPTVIAILVATALLTIVVFAVMQSAVSAGRINAVFGVLRGEHPTRAGVDGVVEDTWTFLGLAIAELLAYGVLFGIPTALIVVAVLTGAWPLLLPAIPLYLAAFVASLLVRLLFAFARPAVVVDGIGVVPALRNAFGYVRSHPLPAVGYGALTVGLTLIANVIGGVFGQVGAVTVSTLLPIVFVFPLTDLVKTRMYAQDAGVDLSPPPEPAGDRLPRLRGGFERGLSALGSFTIGHPAFLALSTGFLAGGVLVGLWAGGQVDDLFRASIEARLGQQGPIGSFFNYAANNWSVAAGQSLAGVVFGIPAIVSLVFNGANVGFLYQIETDPEILLAFVLPHGIIEIPALLVSGALGLHLGRVGGGFALGSVDRERLAEAIDRAFQVLVGLAVCFVLAAAIEAFVSPYYWRLLGI
jgi:uncharacterized membrane protein SpoIIM required for sporulation